MEKGGSVAGGSGLHVAPRIDGGIVDAYFVVHVRASGTAADAGVADDFPTANVCAWNDGEGRQVRVERGDTESVFDDNEASIAGVSFRYGDDPVGGDMDWCAVIGADVDAGVECT